MKSIQILVVDDEPVIGKDVQRSLQGLGYTVPGIAGDGASALEMTGRINPDLIIMDVRLNGEMDGIETAMEIKRSYGTPVVYLTALADEETIARAKETEPYGFLLKPFNERELRSVVEMALARSVSQQRLHHSKERFASTLRSMADGVIATNLIGNITFMNPLAEELTGWPAKEAIGRPLGAVFRIQHPGGGGAPPLPEDFGGNLPRAVWLTTRGGAPLLIEDNSAPLKDENGSLTGLVVVFRHRPDGAPRDSDPSLAGLVEGIGDPLIALDAEWKITFVNRQAAAYFEKGPEEMLGKDIWDEFPGEVHARYYHEYYQAMTRRERRAFEIQTGEKGTWFEVTAYPFGDGLLVLLNDISRRKADEERFRKVEKLESLGLLARGFAHDFNNLLTVLLGNISLAEVKVGEGADVGEEIEMAKRATIQAQGRVQQLLTFARGGAPVRALVDPGELLRQFIATREWAPGLRWDSAIAPDLWWAKLDKAQFVRLLENLLRNAEQATPEGGIITLRATNLPANSSFRTERPDRFEGLDEAEDYLLIEVADSGRGIAPEDLPKVFEPYFTTRQDANATGIGLTVCESIARGHHGAIAIESTEGRGTTVRVCLPAVGSFREVEVLPEGERGPESEPSGRVLILEDDAMIRRLLTTQLRQHGYEVVETAEGTRTVARFREARDSGAPFDLLIMDLSIPNGMGGLRALEEIRQMEPNVVAIVSSGYSDDPVMAEPRKYGFTAVLPKPYVPAELLSLVGSLSGRKR
jgi:two-component system cell cycle sensor histidine kinase/response regulator CckA